MEEGTEVKLYIYDLSMGLAQQLSPLLLGKHFEGIWHTSIVVFNKEYYFGPNSISICEPGTTNLREPNKVITLGTTYINEDLFHEYLNGLKQSTFAVGRYSLLNHNCNTFSNELSQFLIGKEIPKYILELPDDVIRCVTSGQHPQVALFLSQLVTSYRGQSPDYESLNNDIDAARSNNQN